MKKANQKFRYGDLVRVADDLGPSMDHFQKGCNAIVIASYSDKYGGDGKNQYTLFIENGGETSWYYDHQLTFIRNDISLLETWKERQEAKLRDQTDIQWIRQNWLSIRDSISSASVLKIMHTIGLRSSFERNGEYFCLFSDWENIFSYVNFLMTASSVEDLKATARANGSSEELISKFTEHFISLGGIKDELTNA